MIYMLYQSHVHLKIRLSSHDHIVVQILVIVVPWVERVQIFTKVDLRLIVLSFSDCFRNKRYPVCFLIGRPILIFTQITIGWVRFIGRFLYRTIFVYIQ